jgi:hypothetical protein
MSEKPSTILPATVEKIIKPVVPGDPEKAQIAIEGADHPISRDSDRKYSDRREWRESAPQAGRRTGSDGRSSTRGDDSQE